MAKHYINPSTLVASMCNTHHLIISDNYIRNVIALHELFDLLKSDGAKEMITTVSIDIMAINRFNLFDHINNFLSESQKVTTITMIINDNNNRGHNSKVCNVEYVFDLLRTSGSVGNVGFVFENAEFDNDGINYLLDYLSTTTISTFRLDSSSFLARELIGTILGNNSIKSLAISLDTDLSCPCDPSTAIDILAHIVGQIANSELEELRINNVADIPNEKVDSIVKSIKEKFNNNYSIKRLHLYFWNSDNSYETLFSEILERNILSNINSRFVKAKVAETE